jgi:hypothetical protein
LSEVGDTLLRAERARLSPESIANLQKHF